MTRSNPLDAVKQLSEALNTGDLDRALAAYEPGASLILQSGEVAAGPEGLRNALSGFIAMKPTLVTESERVVESGDIALYISRWTLDGRDAKGHEIRMSGTSSDVLRRQSNGQWRIALDNPWGSAVLS